jgi:hypothetical protein
MGVLVSSLLTKSGSTISGNAIHIVVVKTDPSAYGTGVIVATYC